MALRVAFLVAMLVVPAAHSVAVAKPPRLLFTGDSMIAPVAAQATQNLDRKRKEARVLRDVRPGEGISKSWRTNWTDHARIQMRRHRPRATVVFIGANDGFPMLDDRGREVRCCRRGWIEAYARDAGRMMRTYTARRRIVYWLTLPAPNDDKRHRIYAAVNIALQRAALRYERVRLLDMVTLFTPGYRYRRKMKVDGRRVAVRDPDGVHLNDTGAGLALREVRRAMRADGLIRR